MQSGSGLDVESSCLHMESLSGCPDDVMLCFAEVSQLAYWKAVEQRKGTLSLRELLRRADEIEQRLQSRKGQYVMRHNEAPLHPNLLNATMSDPNPLSCPNEEILRLVGNIFRETAALYLHTTVNDMQPGEISAGISRCDVLM